MTVKMARPDDHVVTLVELVEQTGDVSRGMLAIRIHEHQYALRGITCACLDGGTIAHRVHV